MRQSVVLGSFLSMVLVTVMAQAGSVIYVDANASEFPHDGSTWCRAYLSLTDALDSSLSSETTIRVADGTYIPENSDSPYHATFQLVNGVTIKGGYAGCNDGGDLRNIKLYETILSGDLNGDDGSNFTNIDDNCNHVVTGSGTDSTAVIDGLTITAGNGDYGNGGGMLIESGKPTVLNCTFLSNYVKIDGGAIYNSDASPYLKNCRFLKNKSSGNRGGAICNRDNSSPTFINCFFHGNSANLGGTIYSYESHPLVVNCVFSCNKAERTGVGGMFTSHGNPVVINSLFVRNYGLNDGAMENYDCSAKIVNCTFAYNTCENGTAGLRNSHSTSIITNCILWGNSKNGSNSEYIQISDYNGNSEITHCCIQNLSEWAGNGNIGLNPGFIDPEGPDRILGTEDDNFRLLAGSPCIDAGNNQALPLDTEDIDNDGNDWERIPIDLDGWNRFVDDPDVLDTGVADPPLYNEIVDMGAFESARLALILSDDSVTVPEEGTAQFSIVLSQPPLSPVDGFVSIVSGDEDIQVQSETMLSFDSSNFNLPQTVTVSASNDVDWIHGKALINISISGIASAGLFAYESDNDDIPPVVYVNKLATGSNTGTSWGNAFTELRDALDATANRPGSNQVWVAAGQYAPAAPSGSRAAAFRLPGGVDLYGGFSGWEDDLSQRDSKVNRTILTGDLDGNDLPGFQNNQENSYHVVSVVEVSEAGIMDGFIVSGGNANGGYPDISYARGGGLYCDHSPFHVRNCIFVNNKGNFGGAIHIRYRSCKITDCTFYNNSSVRGGGVYCYTTQTFTNCDFVSNAADYGAGVYLYYSGQFNNCIFRNNSADILGGGICSNRYSPGYGLDVMNCTFYANTAPDGTAIGINSDEQQYPGFMNVSNSILWDNGNEIAILDDSQVSIAYSDVYGGWPGTGNLETDPYFANVNGEDLVQGTLDDDLSLGLVSPCVNAGDHYVSDLPAVDFKGEPRVQSCRVDMGALESPYLPYEMDDCNGNGIEDDCDIFDGTSQDWNYDYQPDECASDFDQDGDVDLDDYFYFEICLYISGPDVVPPFSECLTVFDSDSDDDIDLKDFSVFQTQFTGQ